MIYTSPKAEGQAVSTLTDNERATLEAMRAGDGCYTCARPAVLCIRPPDGEPMRKLSGGQKVCAPCCRRVLPEGRA